MPFKTSAGRFLEKLGAMLRKALPGGSGENFPEAYASVVLITTKRCNLKCRTCLRGKSSATDLDIDILDGFLEQAKKLDYDMAALTGGEPILHPRFPELLKKITDHGLKIGLVTNGVRYKDYLELLAPYKDKVVFVAVSLDSHIASVNDAVRGAGVRDAAIEAALAFRRAGYCLKISHVVNRENLPHLEAFVEFVRRELRPFRINIGSVISAGHNDPLVLTPEEKVRLREVLAGLSRRHRDLYIAASTGYWDRMIFCNHFSGCSGLALNTLGEVVFCCDNTGEGFPIGRLKGGNVGEIMAKFFRLQSEVKAELAADRLRGAPDCSRDCDYCSRILSRLTKK